MSKNYIYIAYAMLVLFLFTGAAYNAGYNAKHPNKYIYIKYNTIQNNLVKVLQDCGIHTTKDQQKAMFERLKIERGNN